MEGLLSLAADFVRDRAAVARGLEVDRTRDQRMGALAGALDGFRRDEVSLDELMRKVAGSVREQIAGRGGNAWLWGFKNEDERAFPERLAQAGARAPEVDLKGVLKSLVRDAESLDDEERLNRLLAFADFVADLDTRG